MYRSRIPAERGKQVRGTDSVTKSKAFERSLVIVAQWYHLLPSRTEKWNAAAPKILDWQRSGKIGHRQNKDPLERGGLLLRKIWPMRKMIPELNKMSAYADCRRSLVPLWGIARLMSHSDPYFRRGRAALASFLIFTTRKLIMVIKLIKYLQS